MPKKMKACSYDNDRCFNLDDRQQDEKKVNAKDVFQGYSSNKKKTTKNKRSNQKTIKKSNY
tara:strand:- start:1792 stop:1974 length:183 start_codon:yes stop_codon:yes gene_type:complete